MLHQIRLRSNPEFPFWPRKRHHSTPVWLVRDTVKRFSSGALPTVCHPHQHSPPKLPHLWPTFATPLLTLNPAVDRFRCCLGHQLSIPSVAVAPRSGPASLRTAADSDVLPPAEASSSGHAPPAAPRSSPVVVASSSATNSQSSAAVPAAATDSPSCKPIGSMPGGLGSSGTDGKKAASSSPPACLP